MMIFSPLIRLLNVPLTIDIHVVETFFNIVIMKMVHENGQKTDRDH